jgi:hypothetical protein
MSGDAAELDADLADDEPDGDGDEQTSYKTKFLKKIL